MKTFNDITRELGMQYVQWKDSEKDKNKSRDLFFETINASFDEDTLATTTIEVEGSSLEKVRSHLRKRFPAWKILDIEPLEENTYRALLREDPHFKPFVFINYDDRKVYTRQVVDGSVMLDDELLQEEQPELYGEITETKRVIRPLEELSSEQLAQIQKYIYPGKPIVKLVAPRMAKEEELE